MRAALRDFGAGVFELPPRMHHADGSSLVMSAFSSRAGRTVVKSLVLSSARTPVAVGGGHLDERPLTEVTVVAPGPQRARRLAAALRAELAAVRVSTCRLGDEDLSRAEIVCCATPATSALFTGGRSSRATVWRCRTGRSWTCWRAASAAQ